MLGMGRVTMLGGRWGLVIMGLALPHAAFHSPTPLPDHTFNVRPLFPPPALCLPFPSDSQWSICIYRKFTGPPKPWSQLLVAVFNACS